jgi:hypothetical protein
MTWRRIPKCWNRQYFSPNSDLHSVREGFLFPGPNSHQVEVALNRQRDKLYESIACESD